MTSVDNRSKATRPGNDAISVLRQTQRSGE